MAFAIGNPGAGLRQNANEKPFRAALMAVLKEEPDYRKLRRVASSLVKQAVKGNVAAAKEIADRLDGKVPQGIIGDEGGPLVLQVIRYVVEPDQPIDVTPQTETLPNDTVINNDETCQSNQDVKEDGITPG